MKIKNDKEDFCSTVLSSALANNSRIAYGKGWRCFQSYCSQNKIDPLAASPDMLVDFFITLATKPKSNTSNTLSMGTVVLYKSAINHKYRERGLVSPANHPKVDAVLQGLKRICGMKPRQVKALSEHNLREMLTVCDHLSGKPGYRLIGIRDGAILAVGFAGALRRSELCGLATTDVEMLPQEDGVCERKMFLYIRKSKTDQIGCGQKIAIPEGVRIRPIDRLQTWLRESGISTGPLFQTMRRGGALRGLPLHHSDIPRLVKRYAAEIGIDPQDVSGHSLRAGFVTSAAIHRARLDKIMEVTRHVNPSTVMKYIRDADSFRDHAGEGFL